jgi:hypothetical protein
VPGVGSPISPEEREFRQLLDRAHKIRHAYESRLFRIAGAKVVTRTDQPEFLLTELSTVAHLNFGAALHLIRQPRLAYAAEVHVRSLGEYLGYVAFTLGMETGTPVGSPQQRAICLSLARSRERLQALREPHDPRVATPAKIMAEAKWVALYGRLHTRFGCPFGPTRDWPCRSHGGDVCGHRDTWPCRRTARPQAQVILRATFLGLAQRFSGLDWLPDLYKTASLVAHYSMAERILPAESSGLGREADASFQRGPYTWLKHSVSMAKVSAGPSVTTTCWRRGHSAAGFRDCGAPINSPRP